VDELEDLLRRYRPGGPPSDLRARVVQPRRHWREWLPAAAAAAAAVVFYVLASGMQRGLPRAEGDEAREAAIAAMTATFGGDDLARLQAERAMNLIEKEPREDRSVLPLLSDEVTTP
jgi:hypothetical protein